MFRSLLISWFVLLLPLLSDAQDIFSVISVEGNVTFKNTGSVVKSGSVIPQNAMLVFKGKTSYLAVFNAERGLFKVSEKNSAQFAGNHRSLQPLKTQDEAGRNTINSFPDLKNHFKGDYLLFDNNYIRISPSLFYVKEGNFYYISYAYKTESVNKKLNYADSILTIDKTELLSIEGKPIVNPDIADMQLMFYETDNKIITTPISSFKPVFPDTEILKKEAEIIFKELEKKPFSQKVDAVLTYFNLFYGRTHYETVEQWLIYKAGLKD
ncbi:MAG: hypothetical protein KJ607_14785 [Bacteroidetes bacterium]|nr:hypothetical protein [Bacteroidota bacterium]